MKTFSVRKYGEVGCWNSLKPIVKNFASLLSKDVYVTNNIDLADPCEEQDKFFIRSYCRPNKNWKETICSDFAKKGCFGFNLSSYQTNGFSVPKKNNGKVIKSEKYPVAYLEKNTLYILYDFLTTGSMDAVNESILRIILGKTLNLRLNSEEILNKRKRILKFNKKTNQKNYTILCQDRFQATKKLAEDLLLKESAKIKDTRETYVENNRRLFHVEINTNEISDEKEVSFSNAYEKIINYPFVDFVHSYENSLIVHTHPLRTNLLKDGTIRDLGRFRFEIHENGTIFIVNKTRLVKGYSHPCVPRNGNFIFHKNDKYITDLIVLCQFDSAVEILLKYLQTINEFENMYLPISFWPTISCMKGK